MKNKLDVYYIGLFLLCFRSWLYFSKMVTLNDNLNDILVLCIGLIFLARIFTNKYPIKELILIVILGIISFLGSFLSGESAIFINIMAVLAAKNMDINKILKFILKFNCIMLLLHTIMSIYAVIFDIGISPYLISEGRVRFGFLLRHPNYSAAVLFWTMALFLYLHPSLKKMTKLLIVLGVMLLTYQLTDSRTTLIVFVILFLYYLVGDNKVGHKIVKMGTRYTFPIVSILSIFITVYFFKFSKPIYSIILEINKLLSHRILFAVIAYFNYGLTFFGKKININGNFFAHNFSINTLVIDSYYISCLVTYGIVFLIIYTIFFYKASKEYCDDCNKLIFLLLVIVCAITERYVTMFIITFPMFFMKDVLFKEDKNNEKNSISHA